MSSEKSALPTIAHSLLLLEQEVGDQRVGALHGELVVDRRGHVDGRGVDSQACKALVDARARRLRR